jgi:UDP-N-acetylmuramyl pentapeptide synthase
MARELVRGAREEGAEADWFADARAAAGEVAECLQKGDLLLVKGSRGVALDTLVAQILDRGRTS